MQPANVMQYIIGIDLGTTNCCVAYVDTRQPKMPIQPFRILQLKSQGVVGDAPTLPSVCYLSGEKEFPPRSLEMPWRKENDYFVGHFAKEYGGKVPTRLVQSAKSWLCHSAANRRDKILPFEGGDQKISPVEATVRYLKHIKESWNHVIASGDPEAEFEQQEIVLTVPASFDEAARTLTIEAAKQAGFLNLTLLEEPQAAFYSWISFHENEWDKQLKLGDTLLVCDVGGGTTDFSLIEVTQQGDKLGFSRMAVGDHLLLGGDNMDAAIAHDVEHKHQRELSTTQWLQLVHESRKAKENLLSHEQNHYQIGIQGTGSSVIQGSFSVQVDKQAIDNQLLQGFFGQYEWNEALQLRKTTGIRAMGLPYEDEPSITKHLAHFLKMSQGQPDYVLFNGGAMKPAIFQQAIITSLQRWFPDKNIKQLVSHNLDLAVARGAAYFGKVRRGLGVKIGGGSARSFYLAVETSEGKKGLTLLRRGVEEGATYQPETTFNLTPNAPVSFQLYSSHVRLDDAEGDLVEIDPLEMHALPPIFTVFKYGSQETSKDKIPVSLKIELTPLGTLAVSLNAMKTEHRWVLEFQLKTSTGQDNALAGLDQARTDLTFSEEFLIKAKQVIHDVFSGKEKPVKMMENLENALESSRKDWPVSVLRGLADFVLKEASQRKKNQDLEARWWNLIGFCLRPGYGFPLDDYRIKELWKLILADAKTAKSQEVAIQQWIAYRRISGGLSKGQQLQLAAELMQELAKGPKNEEYAFSEKLRAFSSLELIEVSQKVKIGDQIVGRLKEGKSVKSDHWALGRLGARHLLYGSAVNVISREVAEKWVKTLLSLGIDAEFLYSQLARKTDHREINLSRDVMEAVLTKYPTLLNAGDLTRQEQEQAFGDHLPVGISI